MKKIDLMETARRPVLLYKLFPNQAPASNDDHNSTPSSLVEEILIFANDIVHQLKTQHHEEESDHQEVVLSRALLDF